MMPRDRRRLTLCLFLWGAAEGLFLYLLPLYIRVLGGGATQVGLNGAVLSVTAGVSTVLAGPVVDRIGPRPLIRLSALICLPAVAIWTVAPHWQWVLPGTALYAVSFGVIPALNAYVGSGHDDHVGVFGSTFAFFSLGMIATPLLGGFIAAQAHSIRPLFVIAAVLFVASAVTVWEITPPPLQPHEPLRAAARQIAANRRLLALWAYLVVLLFAASMTNSFVGPYMQDVNHAGDSVVGLLGSCISLGEFLMGMALGYVNARLGRVYTLIALQAILCLSLALVLTVHWLPALAPAFVLRGAIVTGGTMVLAIAGGVLPVRQRGAGFGIMEMAFQGGMTMAAYAAGLLYVGDPARPFIVSLALVALAMPATLLLAPLFAEKARAEATAEVRIAR